MSNSQPPPYEGGHPSYAQWPPPYPGMIPPSIPPNQYPPTAPPHIVNPSQPFPYHLGGLDPNASVPVPHNGAPAGPGIFYPPPFPYMPQLDPSQMAFPPVGVPPFGYPQMPVPAGSSQAPPEPWAAPSTDASRAPISQAQTRATSYTNSHFEEGEIEDDETEPSYQAPKASRTAAYGPSLAQTTSAPNDDREEGEALSSRRSSRSSSPYNPPLSVSADADVVNRAIELQKQEATTVTSEKIQPPKSAAQLRIQAQGALLGLAPHNIRYDELVAEGINPAILKQLYEEVGIRVATPKVEKQTTSTSVPPKPSNPPKMADPISKPALPTKASKTVDVAVASTTEDEAKKAALAESSKPLTVVSPPSSNKPMERKEVIARMLAAKAAKATESKVTPKDTPSTTPPNGSPAKSNGAVVKQKNKAQTELARQRIEELKKQAMMKIEEKKKQLSQAPPAPVPSEEPTVNPVISVPAVQHPLPVRPPPSSNSAQIPGLSLTGADEDGDNLPSESPVPQAIGVDSTPVSRAAQRKRPRASDFDEPTILPKKPFSYSATPSDAENKLIIDISEDESLYGDDEGANMDVDSSPEQELAPAPSHDAPKPPISRTSSTGRLSTATPQGNDQENLREKDLQIQAMHRRIAELEQKRKDKLAASRTQSPRPLSDSVASSSVQSSAAGPEALETSVSAPALSSDSKLAPGTCTTSISTLVERPDIIDSFSEASIRALASMDLAQLDSIRSKILRIKEIESGLPELDAAIESSEQRLAAFKQEADSLIAEITMGKAGRLQLFQELRKLIDEIDGLTLEDLDELRRQAEIKEQHLVTQEVTVPPVASISADAQTSPTPETHLPSNAEISASADIRDNGTTQNGDAEDIHEPASPSDSDSGDSAMDESSDSDSSVDESSVQEDPTPSSPAADAEPTLETPSEPSNSHSNAEAPSHSLPARPMSEAEDVAMVDDENTNQETEQSRRETSEESDDYEPPEPDTGAESPGSAYSPPLSPAPLAILDDTSNQTSQPEQPPDDAFMSAPPMPAWESRPITEILGAPGTKVPPTELETKFTPYISPLRMFQAYRFHPDFLENVSDGYRSLTYSHDIDSMKMLCPYELAGGVCNDNTCGFQHFRDMTPSDDKILVQMGALREGQTEEEKEEYRTGLKEIINGMRRDKVKDFITVANEIAAYRRRVLQDPTRVLHL